MSTFSCRKSLKNLANSEPFLKFGICHATQQSDIHELCVSHCMTTGPPSLNVYSKLFVAFQKHKLMTGFEIYFKIPLFIVT